MDNIKVCRRAAMKSLIGVIIIWMLGATASQAQLILDIYGTPGDGYVTVSFSFYSESTENAYIRAAGSEGGSYDNDTWEVGVGPDGTKFFTGTTGLYDISGIVTISVGSASQTLTQLYFDEFDAGIRTDVQMDYEKKQDSVWSGTGTIALDITFFGSGAWGKDYYNTKAGPFSADSVYGISINVWQVPEPGIGALFGLGLVSVWAWRRYRA